MSWNCYILFSNGRSYTGASNNVDKRLRQHNGELVGGAKATQMNRPWKHLCVISGFDKSLALCCEWRLKRKKSKYNKKLKPFGGIKNKIENVYEVLNLERYTSKCPKSSLSQLTLTWYIHPEVNYKINSKITLPSHIEEVFVFM